MKKQNKLNKVTIHESTNTTNLADLAKTDFITLKTTKSRFVFIMIAILNLLAVGFNIFWLEVLTKPFITLLLILIILSTFANIILIVKMAQTAMSGTDENGQVFINPVITDLRIMAVKPIWYISISLLFCFLGDVFLLFNATFLVGLVCFLIGHYNFWRFLWINSDKREGLVMKQVWLSIPFLIYLGLLLYYILPHLKNDIILQIAVIIYGSFLSISAILALNRFGSTNTASFVYVLIGFVFFIISDTWIAWQKFVLKTDTIFDGLGVMSTYILALYFIVEGVIKGIKSKSLEYFRKEIEEIKENEGYKAKKIKKNKYS